MTGASERRFQPPLTIVALSGVIFALHALGSLPSIQLPSPMGEEWGQWSRSVDVATATFAVVRMGALVLAWYSLVTTVLLSLAHAFDWRRAGAVVEAITPSLLRGVARSALGASLATGLAVPTPALADTGTAVVDYPVLRHVPTSPTPPPIVDVPAGTPDLVPAPDASTAIPDTFAAETQTPMSDYGHPRWTVELGDNMWAIAKNVLTEHLGRAPSTSETVAYWRTLIDANRATLDDPRNPDLIFPGQLLVLPPL